MGKKERNPERDRLMKELLAEYQPKNFLELQDILKEIFAPLMEDMLKGELDAHLGYAKNEQAPKMTTNRRNGSFSKTVRSQLGELTLDIPRDREGDFEPALVPNGKRDVSGVEEKVLSMYAKGLSDRDISTTIDEIYGFTLSHDTVSRIVDRVQPRLTEWQSRTLCECYPFLYVDALFVPVKSDGKAVNKAIYSIIGINADGIKDCLGFWISDKEGAHFWLSIFDELKSRGVKKLGFVSIDGLTGLEEGIKNVYPGAVVQRCMVHLVRNSIKYIPSKYYKSFCADLKAMYGAASLTSAQAALEAFIQKWSAYPSAIKVWTGNFRHVEQLFEYPAEIRKIIYTTNMIEAFNSALRKVTNRKAAFPNDNAVFKILFLRTMDIVKKWIKPISGWAIIRGKLDIVLPNWDIVDAA
jgi:transposase-like protein